MYFTQWVVFIDTNVERKATDMLRIFHKHKYQFMLNLAFDLFMVC